MTETIYGNGLESSQAERPTPAEIAELAKEIRDGWGRDEEQRRRVGPANRRVAAKIPGTGDGEDVVIREQWW